MRRLELKGKHLEVEPACFEYELEAFWEILLQVDPPTLFQDDTSRIKRKAKTDFKPS